MELSNKIAHKTQRLLGHRALIIADLQPHSLGGHFKTWLDHTLNEASEFYSHIAVWVADKESLPEAGGFKNSRNVNIHQFVISEYYARTKYCGDILSLFCKLSSQSDPAFEGAPVFVMWAQQFLERGALFPPKKSWNPFRRLPKFNRPWGSLTSVSSVAFELESPNATEKSVHEMIQTDDSCRGVFLWDKYTAQKLNFKNKYIYLPNIEKMDLSDAKNRSIDHVVIGSVGQLWGARSVNLLAEILKSQTECHGYLGGVFKRHSYTELAKDMLDNPLKFRLATDEGYLADEFELNKRIARMDAFLIDSRTYKCPSGLGIRAMGMGRPLIAFDSPSWTAEVIKEFGVGVFFNPFQKDLSKDIKNWYLKGGSKRAVEFAKQTNDFEGLKKSYSTMFKRLSCEKTANILTNPPQVA